MTPPSTSDVTEITVDSTEFEVIRDAVPTICRIRIMAAAERSDLNASDYPLKETERFIGELIAGLENQSDVSSVESGAGNKTEVKIELPTRAITGLISGLNSKRTDDHEELQQLRELAVKEWLNETNQHLLNDFFGPDSNAEPGSA
jgi:hypothetical protein